MTEAGEETVRAAELAAVLARAAAHHAQGQAVEAVALYRQVLDAAPDHPEALTGLGTLLHQVGLLDKAAEYLGRAVQAWPQRVEGVLAFGCLLLDQGKPVEALPLFERVVTLQPTMVPARLVLADLLREQGHLEPACAHYRAVLAAEPKQVAAINNLGIALQGLEQLDQAVDCYRRALEFEPNHPEVLSNLGCALKDQGAYDQAIRTLKWSLQLRPNSVETLKTLGQVLLEQNRLDAAAAAFGNALDQRPDHPELLGLMVHTLRHACDWLTLAPREAALLEQVRRRAPGIAPFILLALETTPAEQLSAAEEWSRQREPKQPVVFTAQPAAPAAGKVRLGYLSADFYEHATAYLMAELFERHDRTRFEVIGYSTGPDDRSPMRKRLVKAFDRFVDVRGLTDREAAEQIYGDGLDILVDLKGYTRGARTRILACRPAPVQVSYVGYPGTMGAAFIDYLIADPTLVPPEHRAFYREQLVLLPDSYQPNDRQRPIAEVTPSRAACGLPAQGFVFCCFNSAYKISPALFDLWMDLLQAVPGSVLWLFRSNRFVPANFAREAAMRGIDPARLIFASDLPLAEHLARYRLADLFLDTLPYNGHTTTSDALWAGLPVVTCLGGTFASRVAASLLRAVGLPELITDSLEAYRALALALARDPERLDALRDRLLANRASAPLFDSGRITAQLEAAYLEMVRQRGRSLDAG